jgi:hypothetical protein
MTLNQNDHFHGGTKQQYKQIATVAMGDDLNKKVRDILVSDCKIRGGCFWSERLQMIVPGKLRNGGQNLSFEVFFERLKATVNY